jgi:hypothetical protein
LDSIGEKIVLSKPFTHSKDLSSYDFVGLMGVPPYAVIIFLVVGITASFTFSMMLIRGMCKRRVIDQLVLLEEGNLNDHDEVEVGVKSDYDFRNSVPSADVFTWNLPGIEPESMPQPVDRTLTIRSCPGSLGILIENSARGPMIRNVNSDSRVHGQLVEGDVITSVNGVDVTSWDSRYLSKFLKVNATTGKTITVIRSVLPNSPHSGSSTQSQPHPTLEPQTSTSNQPMYRTVSAPPGTLGIVLMDCTQGPKIKEVKQKSSMQGKLFGGDVITAVNKTDVSKWTSEDLTKFLNINVKAEKKFTVHQHHTTTTQNA